jgi:hypothetical protein
MDRLLAHRQPAPSQRLIDRTPGLGTRRRLVEACRGELAWAREDWFRIASELGLPADPHDRLGDGFNGSFVWEAARLPHEQAAARLLNVWGHLHPVEHRLREAIGRVRARRAAGWDATATLEDVAWYRRERRKLVRAFLEAASEYRRQRAKVGWIASASGWLRQNARTVSNLWRRAS